MAGAFGTVWKATQQSEGENAQTKQVAVKSINGNNFMIYGLDLLNIVKTS